MVRLVAVLLAILVLILEVDSQSKEVLYKYFKYRYDLCHQHDAPGTCRVTDEYHYYNPATQKCERSSHERCGGKSNRFPTKKRCIEVCIQYRHLVPSDWKSYNENYMLN